jgi:2-phospho-L-lactate guanylyltransferase
MASWTVVIPVKGTTTGKSRLGASSGLARAIALDTVAAAVAAADRVIVVTGGDAAPFEAVGAEVAVDAGGGLNAAARQGIALATGPAAVLLGDLPALVPAELSAALAAAEAHVQAMVADADSEGTTLITALRGDLHSPAFGVGSRAAHLSAGYIELDVPAASGLRRDVDTAAQLADLRDRVGPRTAAALNRA